MNLIKQNHLGYVEIVKLLIQNGANLSYVDRFGETALFAAIRNGSSEM